MAVYFIEALGLGLVKIGHTASTRRRLADLQVGSPVKLVPIAWFRGGRAKEESLHYVFNEYRRHGEWFVIEDDLMAYIESWDGPGRPADLNSVTEHWHLLHGGLRCSCSESGECLGVVAKSWKMLRPWAKNHAGGIND